MELIDKKLNGVTLKFTPDELLIVNNALNETLNGIDVQEFSTRIGASESDVAKLLKAISSII